MTDYPSFTDELFSWHNGDLYFHRPRSALTPSPSGGGIACWIGSEIVAAAHVADPKSFDNLMGRDDGVFVKTETELWSAECSIVHAGGDVMLLLAPLAGCNLEEIGLVTRRRSKRNCH